MVLRCISRICPFVIYIGKRMVSASKQRLIGICHENFQTVEQSPLIEITMSISLLSFIYLLKHFFLLKWTSKRWQYLLFSCIFVLVTLFLTMSCIFIFKIFKKMFCPCYCTFSLVYFSFSLRHDRWLPLPELDSWGLLRFFLLCM